MDYLRWKLNTCYASVLADIQYVEDLDMVWSCRGHSVNCAALPPSLCIVTRQIFITYRCFLQMQDYVRSDPTGRTLEDTTIIQVKQGYEPLNFTGHFHGWDRDKWSVSGNSVLIWSLLNVSWLQVIFETNLEAKKHCGIIKPNCHSS